MSNDWVYDIETYPNVFTFAAQHAEAPIKVSYEISHRRNDSKALIAFLNMLRDTGSRMVGFNNIGFDYPVIHMLMNMGLSDANTLYQKAISIIGAQESEDRWVHQVYPSDRRVPQIDLFKIHHFDNKARSTSLKALQFNMRVESIEDLPFPVGTMLTDEQIEVLKQYNDHDVLTTAEFYRKSLDMIRFREELSAKYPDKDWINFNDTKIGKEYFIMELERAGVECYEYGSNGRQPKQTIRPVIRLRDAILPTIEFQRPEFQRVLDWLKAQEITETKGVFKDLKATVNGLDFVFGTGGIHASIERETVYSTDDDVILDYDVASYYPNLAIANGFYPEHLGASFPVIYKHLYEQRKTYPKGSAENAMLKLALNGVYGDSNNRFSVFYDPLFTMKITLNGQLLLCVLAEKLMRIGGVRVIQCNTDGITIRCPRKHVGYIRQEVDVWQIKTRLTLEEAVYKKMVIRDVNNYIAEYENGKVKRKGAYEWVTLWHQDASALVVPKVAEKVLIEGLPIRETIENWQDKHDFMLRIKVPRSSRLLWGDEYIQNTTRYYIANSSKSLVKEMPPLKGKTDVRRIGVQSGWQVQVCNDIHDAVLPINYDWYVQEVEKLVLGVM